MAKKARTATNTLGKRVTYMVCTFTALSITFAIVAYVMYG